MTILCYEFPDILTRSVFVMNYKREAAVPLPDSLVC